MKQRVASDLVCVLSALSWMPHWSCHYYRLETSSSFVAGAWQFSPGDSVLALFVYGTLVALGALCLVARTLRPAYLTVSGLLHLTIVGFQLYRLASGLPFVVFGYSWSVGATIRECVLAGSVGIVFLASATMAYVAASRGATEAR